MVRRRSKKMLSDDMVDMRRSRRRTRRSRRSRRSRKMRRSKNMRRSRRVSRITRRSRRVSRKSRNMRKTRRSRNMRRSQKGGVVNVEDDSALLEFLEKGDNLIEFFVRYMKFNYDTVDEFRGNLYDASHLFEDFLKENEQLMGYYPDLEGDKNKQYAVFTKDFFIKNLLNEKYPGNSDAWVEFFKNMNREQIGALFNTMEYNGKITFVDDGTELDLKGGSVRMKDLIIPRGDERVEKILNAIFQHYLNGYMKN